MKQCQAISTIFLCMLLCLSSTANASKVAYYHFDEDLSQTTTLANEIVGGWGTATASSGVANTAAPYMGESFWFYGQTAFVDTHNTLSATGDWTIAGWSRARADIGTSRHYLCGQFKFGENGRMYLMGADTADNLGGRARLRIQGSVEVDLISNESLIGTGYRFITATREGNTFSLYVDGILQDSVTVSSVTLGTSSNLTIGNRAVNEPDYAHGYCDEISIYDEALSDKDVYDAFLGKVAEYYFDETLTDGGSSTIENTALSDWGDATSYGPSNTSLPFINEAFWFYGSDVVSTNNILPATGDWTIAGWARVPSTIGSYRSCMYAIYKTGADGCMYLMAADTTVTGSKVRLKIFDSNGTLVDLYSAYNILDDEYHFITATRNGDTFSLYIDGVLEDSTTVTGVSLYSGTDRTLCIGNLSVPQYLSTYGVFDEMSVYDKALTATQIDSVYQNTSNGQEYYFDSVNGSDSNNGRSPAQAWQSLSKFNSAKFQPGDHIYFKAGCTWNGNMTIGNAWYSSLSQGSGTAANPIVIDAYGDISNKNNKPRINGYPYDNNTIYIESIQYWEINNLQITNNGPTDGTPRNAVKVASINYGQMNHIYLKDLYVHDVRGITADDPDVWGNGGISTGAWDPDNGQYDSYLNDILIEDCYIEDVDPYGVFIGGGSKYITEQQATNIVVRGNYFEDLRSSAILVTSTNAALVEYNEVNRARGVGMWPFCAHNTVFQYNEVYDTINDGDGNAYDCDYECIGTIFQYNYSHDNPGGFMLICNEPQNENNVYGNQNPTVRYNISCNDGGPESIFYIWKTITNASIYNNFIYIPEGKDVRVLDTGYNYGDGTIVVWNNNIIYSHGTARYVRNDDGAHWWDNNCFYGTHKIVNYRIGDLIIWKDGHPSGNNNITSNPNVMSLSYGNGLSSVSGYRLWSNSPCIGAGLSKFPGGEDFWGNPLYTGNPDIGPHEQ